MQTMLSSSTSPCLGRRGEQLDGRLQQRALGPAHQRLVADDAALAEAEDRLEDGREAALLEHLRAAGRTHPACSSA